MKLVLTILGIAILVLSALVGGGYYWFNKNKDEYAALLQEYVQLGRNFGQDKMQSDCMDGLMQKMENCSGIMRCQFASVGFIRGCMTVAGNDNYCDQVPKREDFLKSVSWSIAACQKQKLDDDSCQRYIRGFVEICAQQRQAQAPSTLPETPAGRPAEQNE